MLKKNLKQIPVFLALTTGAGILMHDTQFDQAAMAHINYPDAIHHFDEASRQYKTDRLHIHAERPIYEQNNSSARSQTRLSDDKKYIIAKRLAGSNNDFDYIWPSV